MKISDYFEKYSLIIQYSLKIKFLNFILKMGNDCSACSCNDQKQIDEMTGLYLDKNGKNKTDKLTEKE